MCRRRAHQAVAAEVAVRDLAGTPVAAFALAAVLAATAASAVVVVPAEIVDLAQVEPAEEAEGSSPFSSLQEAPLARLPALEAACAFEI